MSGLATYNTSNQTASADVGFAILQAGKQSYLTDAGVQAATSADDLIALVYAAVVPPGGESFSQRNSIARAIKEGENLGDLSPTRVQAATGVTDLAEKTWVTNFPAYATGQLGPNLLP